MYAVIPAQVRENSMKMDAREIVAAVAALEGKPGWVTLSGGNPALLRLEDVVAGLHDQDFRVSVETQGSRWRDWLAEVDCLTVSPKPPSSEMVTAAHTEETARFMARANEMDYDERALKIVVFDETDLWWAENFIANLDTPWATYLSVGTVQPDLDAAHLTASRQHSIDQICDSYAWLCERVARNPDLARVQVLPQLHVLAWGHARAV